MTSKNLNWKNRKTVYKPRPFLLQPACKEALWGGQKLKEHFGKQADLDNIAESWECSTHPEGPSTVTTGGSIGNTLLLFCKRTIPSSPIFRPACPCSGEPKEIGRASCRERV